MPKKYLKSIGIPGLISAVSLLFAWLAIVLLLKDALRLSVLCAVIAFFFDSLDGIVARKLRQESDLGRQLDSMIDLVSYSLYPALIVSQELLPSWEGVVVGYTIVLFGILRLIRFNVDGYIESNSVRYYNGVVTCYLSLAAIGFLLLSSQYKLPSLLVAGFLLILAILQLSNIKTRKTGMLKFWYAVSIILALGALAWLP